MNHVSTRSCNVRSTSTDSSVNTGAPSGHVGKAERAPQPRRDLGVDARALRDLLAGELGLLAEQRAVDREQRQPALVLGPPDLFGRRAAIEQELLEARGSQP